MPSIVLDGTGPSKSSLVETAYDFCGLSGDQYERTPEEMSKGLRLLNGMMASLKTLKGIDLGYDFANYGEGLLEEPSGIPEAAREPVSALLAQRIAPTIGATLSDECRAVLSSAVQDLLAYYAAPPPSRVPAQRLMTVASRRRRSLCRTICDCLGVTTETPATPPPATGGSGGGTPTVLTPVSTGLPTITGTPSVGQVLTCSQGTWSNSPTSYAYQWLRSGIAISGANSSTYTLVSADAETDIACLVSAINTAGTSSATSASISIGAAVAPTNTAAPTITGSPQQGQMLSATTGTWLHAPTSYAYQWNRGGVAISGAVLATYVLASADVGSNITCTVTAANTVGSTPANSNALGPVIALAPVNTAAPVVSGTVTQGQVLSTTNGTWTNAPTAYAYQWKRAGAAISGATSSTYTLTSADVGVNISCAVTASNTGGSNSAGSNSVGPVLPLAPTVGSAPVIAGIATQGQTLTLTSNGTWANSPTGFAFQWNRAGTPISGATASTYLLVSADVGVSITCTVTASNAGGSGTATSNSIGPIAASSFSSISAPTLGYPSPIASNPTTIAVSIPVDWQTGDVLKLARSSSVSMSSPTILTHTLTDADIAAGTFSIGLSGVTLSGTTFFQAYGAHSGLDSVNKSALVAWGDTTAPTITTSATQTITETTQLALALTATDAGGVPALVSDGVSPGWCITGGGDQLQFQVAVVSGNPVLQWYGNGSQLYSTPKNQTVDSSQPYNVTIGAIDYSGNKGTLALAETVTQIDRTPTAFSFTNVTGATLSTQYTSNTITVAGLEPGFAIAASVAGAGFTYSKNGGAYTAAGSFTVVNGDTLTLRDTSASTNNVTNVATVTVGTYSATWSVATPGSAATLTIGTGATGAGVDRSHYIDVASPGYQFIHNNNDGGLAKVQATVPAANTKFHVEFAIDGWFSGSNGMHCGIIDGTADLNTPASDFNYPGTNSVPGMSFFVNSGASSVSIRFNNSSPDWALGVAADIGDRVILEVDTVANTFKMFYWDASAGALVNGGAALGTQSITGVYIPATYYVFCGGHKGTGSLPGSDAGTVTFNPANFIMTPSAGYTYYA